MPPRRATSMTSASRRSTAAPSKRNGPVGPPIRKAVSGRGKPAKRARQTSTAAAMLAASTRISGSVIASTLGKGGSWASAPAITRSKRSIMPDGLPSRTSRVRPPDCSPIQSATIEGRRPIVSTRSGQGGSSGSERARSMWCREGDDPRLALHIGCLHVDVFALAGPAQRRRDDLDLSVVAALVAEHQPDPRRRRTWSCRWACLLERLHRVAMPHPAQTAMRSGRPALICAGL